MNHIVDGRLVRKDPLLPQDMLLELNSPSAALIDEDPDWHHIKVRLRALFQKYGAFQIDVAKKGLWVPSSHVV